MSNDKPIPDQNRLVLSVLDHRRYLIEPEFLKQVELATEDFRKKVGTEAWFGVRENYRQLLLALVILRVYNENITLYSCGVDNMGEYDFCSDKVLEAMKIYAPMWIGAAPQLNNALCDTVFIHSMADYKESGLSRINRGGIIQFMEILTNWEAPAAFHEMVRGAFETMLAVPGFHGALKFEGVAA